MLVEMSSYESEPFGRMEWVKLYGALIGKENEAAALFEEKMDSVSGILGAAPTGKTVTFFYVTSNGAVNVRKSTDYVAKSIAMAGGEYVSFDNTEEENAQSTVTIQMEAFTAAHTTRIVLICNSIIDGGLTTIDELLALEPLLGDFKAVQNGNVWCLTKDFYQESLELSDLVVRSPHRFERGGYAAPVFDKAAIIFDWKVETDRRDEHGAEAENTDVVRLFAAARPFGCFFDLEFIRGQRTALRVSDRTNSARRRG
ncbi:MAG: ABC transporter substrate-binding protein [Oscillibacter sp.]